MRIGSVHVTWFGSLEEVATNPCLFIVWIWRLIFGFEAGATTNPWLMIYLGRWAVEVYWDKDGSWDDV